MNLTATDAYFTSAYYLLLLRSYILKSICMKKSDAVINYTETKEVNEEEITLRNLKNERINGIAL